MTIAPFRIEISQATLDDLQARLQRTRFIRGMPGAGWDYGIDASYLRELCVYWRDEFDWRRQEAMLNGFDHFRSDADGSKLHFVHVRGKGANPIPLLLIHGWPDSFVRFLKLIPLLTDGWAQPCFNVVVPSLPGYGFSDRPTKRGTTFDYGDRLHELMTDELGYKRYAVHGGDWGSTITEHIARSHPRSVLGIHLTDVPFFHAFQKPDDLSPAEAAYFECIAKFPQTEGAYALIQSTKPQTLAAGLNDSPAGLAAWIVEKFRAWSDCDGDVENALTRDEILTDITIYWVTQTIDSSFFTYYDMANAGTARWIAEGVKDWLSAHDVPAAFSMFPKEISHPPREWAERFFNVQRWTEMPRGGHFAAMEQPTLLADELRASFGKFSSLER